jgi:signal transduction histidine kinase
MSFLEAADRQSDRLRRLIEQLLAVARIQTHAEPASTTIVSIPHVVRYVTDELTQVIQGHTFDVRVDDLPLLETDEGKVHQIVANLVENAIKYSPPDTRITIEGRGTGDGVLISVHDEGPGIPSEAQERIFERFYQADATATRKVGGTGLGLYICRRLTDQLDGKLWLDRTSSDGSVFCLWVPLAPVATEADPDDAATTSSPEPASV